jgi:hypothetical protein
MPTKLRDIAIPPRCHRLEVGICVAVGYRSYGQYHEGTRAYDNQHTATGPGSCRRGITIRGARKVCEWSKRIDLRRAECGDGLTLDQGGADKPNKREG